MQKTNIIGASLALVDRFTHLDQAELTKIEDDAGKWYMQTKDKLYDSSTGQPIADKKPGTVRERFVWLSEQWWFRILVGLFFALVALPWARKRAHSADDETPVREKRGEGRSRRYDADGYDREGFDRDGYDRDGYDRDGIDDEGYDEDGNFVGFEDDEEDDDDEE